MIIKKELKNKQDLINNKLELLVQEKDILYNELFKAARYSLLAPGKRLRPIMTLVAVEMFGIDQENALIPACALEMIHTSSLILDDLPCMDNDNLRRGRPTLHKAFPESHALLAGDFLLTYAFEIISTAPKLSAEQKNSLIMILAQRSGGDGLVAGQIIDLEHENKPASLETLKLMHSKKTSALFMAALEFGGIVASCSTEQLSFLRQIGLELGLAFQIIDDVLDNTVSEKTLGKTKGSDIDKNKSTYTTLLGIEKAREHAHKHFDNAMTTLEQLPGDHSLLKFIAKKILTRKF
jgi:geranylgeranyl diphosphate synthase, type II